jgi:hypothetical protein
MFLEMSRKACVRLTREAGLTYNNRLLIRDLHSETSLDPRVSIKKTAPPTRAKVPVGVVDLLAINFRYIHPFKTLREIIL